MRSVLVPVGRVPRWFENFETRHGAFETTLEAGRLVATAADGAVARAQLPWGRALGGAGIADLAAAAQEPIRWGLLLVRRGGFAVAAGTTPEPAVHKVGRRHVQGQTKAGGWSQQRYARRRANQADAAFEAAADHAYRVLVGEFGGVDALTCGGDRLAVDAVLADPRLGGVAAVRTERWLGVPDPSAKVLTEAVRDAWSISVQLEGPD